MDLEKFNKMLFALALDEMVGSTLVSDNLGVGVHGVVRTEEGELVNAVLYDERAKDPVCIRENKLEDTDETET